MPAIPSRHTASAQIDETKVRHPSYAPGIDGDAPYRYERVFFGCTLANPENQPWEPARRPPRGLKNRMQRRRSSPSAAQYAPYEQQPEP